MDPQHSTIAVREFQAAGKDRQQELIPEVPGLYLWTHNLEQLLGADELSVQNQMKNLLELVGRPRTKVVRPYYSVAVGDARLAIRDTKRLLLQDSLACCDPFGEWLARTMTRFQRPLYAGMTIGLFSRTQQHLAQGSKLRTRLEQAGADMLDLAITWVQLPDLDDDDEDEAAATKRGEQLSASESLLIRLTMPMFNERQD